MWNLCGFFEHSNLTLLPSDRINTEYTQAMSTTIHVKRRQAMTVQPSAANLPQTVGVKALDVTIDRAESILHSHLQSLVLRSDPVARRV